MTRQAHAHMKYILLILALAVRVAAASITHTATVFPTRTDWAVTNSVPQFDTSLGTLTNVTVSVAVNASTQFRAENRDTVPALTVATAEVTAVGTAAGHATVVTVTNVYSTTLSAFDGVIDFAGTSGFTETVLGSDSGGSSPASFTPFIGTGSVPLTASASATAAFEGSGFARFVVNTFASAIVTVTYEFSPPACEPQPLCEPKATDCGYTKVWSRKRR